MFGELNLDCFGVCIHVLEAGFAVCDGVACLAAFEADRDGTLLLLAFVSSSGCFAFA